MISYSASSAIFIHFSAHSDFLFLFLLIVYKCKSHFFLTLKSLLFCSIFWFSHSSKS